jgi:hypothetical protein
MALSRLRDAPAPVGTIISSAAQQDGRTTTIRGVYGAVLGAAAVFLLGTSCSRQQPAANAQRVTPQLWEYKVVYVELWGSDIPNWDAAAEKGLTSKYNELGADGWEYVGAHRGNSVYAVFKRPKK